MPLEQCAFQIWSWSIFDLENSFCLLTLKCLSYFSLPFVHKGGRVHLDPFIFEYFPIGILVQNLHHMCIHPKQPYISKKNNQKMFRFKMVAKKTNFRFAKTVT